MPKGGLEPPRACAHWLLKPARLPVPPLRRFWNGKLSRRYNPKSTLGLTALYAVSILPRHLGQSFHRPQSTRATRLPPPGNVGGGSGVDRDRSQIPARRQGESG